MDMVKDTDNNIMSVTAPKDPETLEQISNMRNEQRRLESLEDDDGEKLKIMDEIGPLGAGDIQLIGQPNIELMPDLLIDDIEVLP